MATMVQIEQGDLFDNFRKFLNSMKAAHDRYMRVCRHNYEGYDVMVAMINAALNTRPTTIRLEVQQGMVKMTVRALVARCFIRTNELWFVVAWDDSETTVKFVASFQPCEVWPNGTYARR